VLENVEAEAALLGALMVGDAAVIDLVADRLRPDHFSLPIHQRIYAAVLKMHGGGKTVTPVILKPHFDDDPDLPQLGGVGYLARLTSDGMGLLGPQGLADQLIDLALRRNLRERFVAATHACSDLSITVDAVAAQGEVPPEATPGLNARTYTLVDAFATANDRIDSIQAGEIEPGILLRDLQDWDDITRGMMPGAYILIGGRPSMGKTALSLGVSWRAAAAGHGVLYISREMDIVELMPRIQADLLAKYGGEATFQDIREGNVSDNDKVLLRRIGAKIRDWPLVIIDPETFGADQINAVIRQQARKFEQRGHKLGLVVIDYLGLVDPPPATNRNEEVTAISKAIKMAARSNRVPVIVLTQLNRSVEQREDKHPELRDLRDSGSLEQDADIVVFVYRDQYYLERTEPNSMDAKRQKWEEDMAAAKDKLEIYSAKNRQGALCRRTSWFFGNRQSIRNSDFYMRGG